VLQRDEVGSEFYEHAAMGAARSYRVSMDPVRQKFKSDEEKEKEPAPAAVWAVTDWDMKPSRDCFCICSIWPSPIT
jgi:hypothetical protein